MSLLLKIKNILLKFWNWITSFFTKKKIIKHKFIKRRKRVIPTKKDFKASINRDEALANLAIATYPGIIPKELESINKKIDEIRKKIINYSDENLNNEINNIKIISDIVNNNMVLTNQIGELNDIIDLTLYDEELHLSTNEKISILKDDIATLFDDRLKDYEEHIVKKAYYEYDKVNYVIVTTMLIDELNEELEKVYENYNKNHYDKKTFIDKVREIEKKINRFEKINDREEVRQEIEILKNDLYTKRKDKYDLLYNNEIFINIQNRCDEILRQTEIKEKQEKLVKVQKAKEYKETKEKNKNEQNKKELERRKDEFQEDKKIEENILKRFMDLELARQILLQRELERIKNNKNEDIIQSTVNSYQEFLDGDVHEFNFLRNKVKLEVTKLYNDTLRNICILEDVPFMPIEHINIKLSDIVQEILDNQQRLNRLIIEKRKFDLENTEIFLGVNQKLNVVLEKEKKRDQIKGKSKVLVKKYSPPSINYDKK